MNLPLFWPGVPGLRGQRLLHICLVFCTKVQDFLKWQQPLDYLWHSATIWCVPGLRSDRLACLLLCLRRFAISHGFQNGQVQTRAHVLATRFLCRATRLPNFEMIWFASGYNLPCILTASNTQKTDCSWFLQRLRHWGQVLIRKFRAHVCSTFQLRRIFLDSGTAKPSYWAV